MSQRPSLGGKVTEPSQYSGLSNSELIDRCVGYDEAAWAEFVARFREHFDDNGALDALLTSDVVD